MTDELPKLQRDYRAIKAPPHLAGRIVAETAARRTTPRWVPALVAATLVIAALLIGLPRESQQPQTAGQGIPSLSQLAPPRPAISMPSQGSIRSVPLPPMPRRPSVDRPTDSQSYHIDRRKQEETHHEHA